MPERVKYEFDTISSSRSYGDHAGWRCDVGQLDDGTSDAKVIACCDEDAVTGTPRSCFQSTKAITFHPGAGLIKSIKIGKDFVTRCKAEKDGSKWCHLESDLDGPVLTASEKKEMLDDLAKPRKGL